MAIINTCLQLPTRVQALICFGYLSTCKSKGVVTAQTKGVELFSCEKLFLPLSYGSAEVIRTTSMYSSRLYGL